MGMCLPSTHVLFRSLFPVSSVIEPHTPHRGLIRRPTYYLNSPFMFTHEHVNFLLPLGISSSSFALFRLHSRTLQFLLSGLHFNAVPMSSASLVKERDHWRARREKPKQRK